MGYILIQRTCDEKYNPIIAELGSVFQTLIAADADMSSAIEEHQHEIDGFVAVSLTEAVMRSTELLTNERFNAPTTPIAYAGEINQGTFLPYGVTHFDVASVDMLVEYLKQPKRIDVLVVEDDDAIRDVLSLSLSRHFSVDCAGDGPQAMQILEESLFDIVVLDVMLPGGISGEEIFTHIRKSQPNAAVVVITAYDSSKRELDFAFRGADAYVPKPFDSNASFRRLLMKTLKDRHQKTSPRERGGNRDESAEAWCEYKKQMSEYMQ